MDAAAGSGSSSSPSPSPLRIVLCPWLAFGHMLPYLELAERLALRGHRVSFVSTPRNLARLPSLRPAAAARVELVALPLPHVDGLPDGAESTNSVSGVALELLWKAFDGLGAPFKEFLLAAEELGERPDWILADTFNHWAATVAGKHKVPCAMLLPTAALIASWTPRTTGQSVPVPGSVFEESAGEAERPANEPRYEWERRARLYAKLPSSGMSIAERCALTLRNCTITAMRSCVEWEGEAFKIAPALLGKPVVPLGLLPPSPDSGRGASVNREHATVQWLDAQPARSVVYVALGSEVPLPVEQVHELALGLELAGARFLWALRKPSGVSDGDILPPGFQDRTSNQGLVTMGWVPQISILSHAAVGAFLTHCGRNSLTEGFLFGHPLIMLPIVVDQGPNARLMERKKVGLQIPRDEDNGSFGHHDVANTIRAVMLEKEKRQIFATNARRMQEIVADQELHDRYVDEFVQQLRSYATDASSAPVEI